MKLNNCKTNNHTRRGIALMLVMVAVLVTGSMAVAYFGSRDNSIAISSNVEASARARAVAESGLNLAVAILETDSDWRTQHADGVLLDAFSFGGGEITVTIYDSETNLPPTESTNKVTISILSSIGGISQTTVATAIIIPYEEEFDLDYSEYAIFSQSEISIQGAGSIQQWTASPLASLQNPLQIGTLATNPMSVQIDSQRQHSNLLLHTPSNASAMISSSISSSFGLSNVLPFLDPPLPPTLNKELVFSDKHKSSGRIDDFLDIQDGSYEIDELHLFGKKTLYIHGDVTLTIHDELILKNASIILADDATLTLHINGDVRIDSSYIGNEDQSINSWSDPSRVKLYGHDDSDWEIGGSSTIKGEMYAPECDIEFRGIATLCGRVAADDVSLLGASRLLYDKTLDHGGFGDVTSSLYNEDETLLTSIQKLNRLDPILIDALYESANVSENNTFQSWPDWWSTPTERPNEVVYTLLVYGMDAHRWESLAKDARRALGSSLALVNDK